MKHFAKGTASSVGKFMSKLATICNLLQAVGGPLGTVPELLFEKKQLIPALQQLLIFYT